MITPAEKIAAIEKIAEASVAAEKSSGCPAALSAAQAIVESYYLVKSPGNNCFGIKDTDRYAGAQYLLTTEFRNGAWIHPKLAFEVYPTLADCFDDHGRLVTGGYHLPEKPNVYWPFWSQYLVDHDLSKLVAGIASKYATDPAYAAKLVGLANDPKVTAAIARARLASALPPSNEAAKQEAPPEPAA